MREYKEVEPIIISGECSAALTLHMHNVHIVNILCHSTQVGIWLLIRNIEV